MVNARLRHPDLATLWQVVYRQSTLTPVAKERLLRMLRALDGDNDTLASLARVDEGAATIRAQILRLHDLTQGVKLPSVSDPAPGEAVAIVDFVSALVLTARDLRRIERETLERKGFSVEGRSTHEALLEVLDQFADVAAPPSMGAADDVVSPTPPA